MEEQKILLTVVLLLVVTGLLQPLIKWLLAALLQEPYTAQYSFVCVTRFLFYSFV